MTTLREESAALHRIVSQRAGQHDAHLTSLSALALSDAPSMDELFEEVAAAILRFYPRVVAVDLVALEPAVRIASTTRDGGASPALLRALGSISFERVAIDLHAVDAVGTRYRLVKRVPGDTSRPARYALALEIDARELLQSDAVFWRRAGTRVSLTLPGGTPLSAAVAPLADETTPGGTLWTEAVLDSVSQPLRLTTGLNVRTSDLLPVRRVLAGLAVVTLMAIALWFVARAMARARLAERQARLGEQSATLARASRINALGEMASGIAHELTQPLTAILSQSQAGLRLIDRDERDAIAVREVLEANVMQSRRAADILQRLRSWTKPITAPDELIDANACVATVALLLDVEARDGSIELVLELAERLPPVRGDAVELEQVIFNLVRNAMEAMREQALPRAIRMESAADDTGIEVIVSDTGPGFEPAMVVRAFEPFASSKPDGMGLGLALCERLVERMDGSIEVWNGPQGAVARLRLPRADVA